MVRFTSRHFLFDSGLGRFGSRIFSFYPGSIWTEKAGVSEYWIVDPERKVIEVYVLKGGVYEPAGRFSPGEKARSEILNGFEVEVGSVFTS